jgi:choline kinase
MNTTLLIMAAGLGSRYGGNKQIDRIGPNGEILMEYSIHDAIEAGFDKVVFVIRKSMDELFREMIGNKIAGKVQVEYAYQEYDSLPEGFVPPADRSKPYGTVHAVTCAKNVIHEPFAVINADDYYGQSAFAEIYRFLAEDRGENEHAMVGYRLRNTVTEHGQVARGICHIENGLLTEVVERVHIEKRGGDAAYTEDDGATFIPLSGDTIVSMNLWGFRPRFMDELWARFPAFLDKALAENPLKAEYFLPTVANAQIQEKIGTVRVLTTDSVWHGMTYAADLDEVRAAIAAMHRDGSYPARFWER